MGNIFFGVVPLIERNLRAWRPYALVYFLRMVEVPMHLYVLGFGLAMLGGLFAPGQSYGAFVLPGLIVWSLWLAVIIESTYTTFVRAFTYRLWQGVLMTPVRLPAILIAEQVVGAIKGLLLMLLAYPFALWFGAIPSHGGFLLAFIPALLLVMVITAMGHLMTSLARSEFDFDIVWPIYATPMFLASGIMFPRERLPGWLQAVGEFFPLTHAIEAMRPLMLGDWQAASVAWHCLMLTVMWAGFSFASYYFFRRRLYE